MGQLVVGDHVADGVDVGDIRAHVAVNGDGLALGQFHPGRFQSDALGVGREVDRHQANVGFQRIAAFHADLHALARLLDAGHLGAGLELDAQLLVGLFQHVADLRFFVGQQVRHHLQNRHLDAVVDPGIGELHADGPAADDDHRLGQVLGQDSRDVGDNLLVVEVNPGERPRPRAGGDDEVLRFQRGLPAIVQTNLHRGGACQLARSVIGIDLVLLHQEADALHQAVGHLAAAFEGHAVVEFQIVEAETKLLGPMLQSMGDLGVLQQRLGGYAADVEAHAAPIFLLHNGRFQAQLRRPNGGHIPARPRAQHDDIILISH